MVSKSRILFGFAYTWLMVGFFTGTLTLLGPVRWLTSALRHAEVPQRVEDLAVIAVIIAYVVASLLLTRWLIRKTFQARSRSGRLGIPIGVTIAAGISLWGWTNPARLTGEAREGAGSVQAASGAEFIFGPYPDKDRLEELKQEGITAVVSLQHPSVVPFEPKGIADEKRHTRELGLAFIHAPMLPWVSSNEASLAKIETLVREGRGRYYVHCGLGRDRVNVVRRLVEGMGVQQIRESDGLLAARTFADRKEPFERGPVMELEPGVWLIPYPNAHEAYGHLLGGQVAHVVSILDPTYREQKEWAPQIQTLLGENRIPLTVLPLSARNPVGAEAIVRVVRAMPRPVAVIVAHTEPGAHPQTEAFVEAYRRVQRSRVEN